MCGQATKSAKECSDVVGATVSSDLQETQIDEIMRKRDEVLTTAILPDVPGVSEDSEGMGALLEQEEWRCCHVCNQVAVGPAYRSER